MKNILRILFLFLAWSNLFSNEIIQINGKTDSNGLFFSGKVVEINNSQEINNTKLFVKFKSEDDIKLLENYLAVFIQQNSYSINVPYAKYLKNNSEDKYGLNKIIEIKFTSEINVIELCNKLNNQPQIEYAVPEFKHSFRYTPNDEKFSQQHYLKLINAEEAWQISQGNPDILIAIVDSGVDIMHEDLRNNIWINTSEIPENGIDDDKNGFIDDISGWDFIGNLSQSEVQQEKWEEDNSVVPLHSSNWHGTHVSGIAAAVSDNTIGIASSSFKSKILPVKVATDNLDPNSGGINATLRGYEGILYAAYMGAEIINVSWGSYSYSPLEEDLIKQAQEYGSLIIAAVGNDAEFLLAGKNDYPAMYPNVLAVGATNTNGGRANYSNYGVPVGVFAPGSSVLSTYPNDDYGTESGCSMSAPLVSSVAALSKSVLHHLTAKELYHQLRSTSKVFGQNQNRESNFYGVLNAENALKYNNPIFPDIKVPGISTSRVKMTYQYGFINNFDQNTFNITLKNYLSDADNVQIKITAIDNSLPTNKIYQIGDLSSGDEYILDYEFKLREDFPWYYAKIPLEIEIIAENYHDFELIELTLLMPTFNQFRVAQEFEGFDIDWINSQAPAYDQFWSIGLNKGDGNYVLASYYDKYPDFKSINPIEPTSLAADSEGNIYITTTTGMLMRSSNRGSSFLLLNDNLLKPKDLHFHNNNLYFTAEDENNELAIYKRNSETVSKLSEINENFLAVEFYNENYALFNLNDNLICNYYNSGQLTEFTTDYSFEGAYFIDAEFINDSLLAFIYTTSGNNGRLDFINFKLNELFSYNLDSTNIKRLYSPKDSDELYLVFDDMSVKMFKDGEFKQLISFNHHKARTVAGASFCGRTQLWHFGKDMAYLEFDHSPNEIQKELKIKSKEEIYFDTTNVNEYESDFVMLENNGNKRAIVESIEIIGDDAFYISSDKPISIKSCALTSIFVNFEPKTYGDFEADLIIKTNSDPNELIIKLYGYGFDPTSVNDNPTSKNEIKVYPNPAEEILTFEIPTNLKSSYYEIFNILGQKLIEGRINPNLNMKTINIEALNTGIYIIKIENSIISFIKK